MANKVKVMKPIGAKPSPEELEAQAKRAAFQKRNSIVELILANAIQGVSVSGYEVDYKEIVDKSLDAADYMMEKLYGVSLKEKE